MPNIDDLLQREIKALEKGADLESVVSNLPEESRPLEPLIKLAAAVRNLPHPDPLLEQSQERRRRLLSSERDLKYNRRSRRSFPLPDIQWRNWRWVLVPALVGVMMLFLFAGASLVGLGLWLVGPNNAQAATLMDVNGQVEVATSPLSGDWRLLSSGDQVHSGQRLRTSGASSVTLVFFDGSRTSIGSDADVTLTRIDGDWGKVLRVVLTQNAGKTSHSVVPLRGKQSSFMVFTPSGAASVHGTTFDVAVNSSGKSRFAVNTGKVLVTNDSSEVFLTPGQVIAAQPGAVLADPAYQFSLQGTLTTNQGSTWIVAGVPFTVDENTTISGNPQVGDEVVVEGRVQEMGEWVADSVALATVDERLSTFTGELEEMGGDTWKIGGWTVLVDGQTDLGENLEAGTPVRVTFSLLEDGRWLAVKIEALQESPEEPTATPSATPDPAAQPVLSFQPDELETAACQTAGSASYSLAGRLDNTASGAEDVALNVELGYQITVGAEFVDSVALDPSAWDAIAAGEQVSFNIGVNLNASAWQSAPEGSEVKLRVFIANETNLADGHYTRLTVTLVARCEDEAQETPPPTFTPTPVITDTETITPTPTVTETATLTPTPVVTDTVPTEPSLPGITTCTGAQPHPTGMTLAERWGMDYAVIMEWFCQGFGFGEIDLAYTLSAESGVPVADIFAMKSSGLGWGQIRQQLIPNNPNENPGNGNPGNGPPGNGNPGQGGPPENGNPGQGGPPGLQSTPEPPDNVQTPGQGRPPNKPPKKKP